MRNRGFGLMEAIVTMGIAGITLAAIAALLIHQQRFYLLTGDASAAEARLYPMKTALAPELWPVNPADGDIVFVGADSLATRVYRGVYAVCGKTVPSNVILTLRQLSANGTPLLTDSALVFNEGPSGDPSDDAWTPVVIVSAGTETCADGSPGTKITVPDVAGLGARTPIGTAVRLFNHGSYWLAERSDGWVLMTNAHAGTPRVITEPLAPSDASQPLTFSYLDDQGDPAATIADIASIEIDAMAIGHVSARPSGQPYEAERTILVKLRNTR